MPRKSDVTREQFTIRVLPSTRLEAKHIALDYAINPGQILDIAIEHADTLREWLDAKYTRRG